MNSSITLTDWPTAHQTLQRLAQWVKNRTLQGRAVTLTVADEQRSSDQNRKLHAALQDISKQVQWSGQRWQVEDWKRLLTGAWMRARGQPAVMVPAIDGAGVDVLYRHTSRLSKEEMSDLIDYVMAWGSSQNVEWSDGTR